MPSILGINRSMLIPASELALRLGTAIVLGAAIGYERSKHDHPAGLRTHSLVSLAAALFMLISIHSLHVDQPHHPGVTISYDPSRIASYVVAGIGFLGGGTIARVGLKVKGLTTAASLWLITAVGLAAGAGLYVAAFSGAGLALAILTGFRQIELRPRPKVRRRVRLDLDGSADVDAVLDRIRADGIVAGGIDLERHLAKDRLTVTIDIEHDDESQSLPLLRALESIPGLRRVSVTHRSCEDGSC
jgi:putative Mg2+ transporter-C (MgtC) family protein